MFPATLQHILVPLDFSAPSDHALDVAVALARPARARLTLLHTLLPSVAFADAGFGVVDIVGVMATDAQAKMSERAARTGLSCEMLVRIGSPVDEILACIDQRSPDLVVMSTHGRTTESDGGSARLSPATARMASSAGQRGSVSPRALLSRSGRFGGSLTVP